MKFIILFVGILFTLPRVSTSIEVNDTNVVNVKSGNQNGLTALKQKIAYRNDSIRKLSEVMQKKIDTVKQQNKILKNIVDTKILSGH